MPDEVKVLFEEAYGSESLSRTGRSYVRTGDTTLVALKNGNRLVSVSQFFRTVFLPQGYPESVSSDYLTYQLWDTIQAFASSITGTLAAQALLKGVGVGDQSATVLAATLTWLLKDGTGMLGRIMFAWMQGTSLDYDAKRWRLFADIINDIAIFLEILAPSFPGFFTFTVCVAGVLKSIVGVAGGSTRAALTQHQARRNNMADVSAKDGSQETLVNLAALLCSLALVPIVTGKHVLIWTLFFMFTSLHLFANYSAVKSVVMETINQSRLHIILQKYLRSGKILPVAEVNSREPVVWKTQRKLQINLGASLQRMCSGKTNITDIQKIFKDSRYILHCNTKQGFLDVVLHKQASVEDQFRACYQAEVLEFVFSARERSHTLNPDLKMIAESFSKGDLEAVSQSYRYMEQTFPKFAYQLQQHGWQTDVSLLGPDEWRADWDFLSGLPSKKNL